MSRKESNAQKSFECSLTYPILGEEMGIFSQKESEFLRKQQVGGLAIKIEDIHLDPIELVGYSDPDQKKRIHRCARSLREKGQLELIYINENFTKIWKGHTRYLAAKELGWKTIKAIIMSEEEWKVYITKRPEGA